MNRDDLLVTVFSAAALFGAAETVLRLKDRNKAKARFLRERWNPERPWERFDHIAGWELTPGYKSETVVINRHGFRGPDLSRGAGLRILCLGDSVTFGPPGEENPYPRILQAELERKGKNVEVINAGVGGHTSLNMVHRLKRLMKLRPDIVIVYAGWADMFEADIARYRDLRMHADSYWHSTAQKQVRSHVCALIRDAMANTPRESIPLSYTPEEFVPFNFEYNLRRIIALTGAYAARTVLVTLPKILPDDPGTITAGMAAKCLLPDYMEMDDFDSFLMVYRSYDAVIRTLAEENDLPLLDLEREINHQKRPRTVFFENMFDLTPVGSKTVGKFMAKKLIDAGMIE